MPKLNSNLGWITRRFTLAALAAGLLVGPSAFAAPGTPGKPGPGYTYFEIGDVTAPTPHRPRSGYLLMGGGDWVTEAYRWFVGRAGGGHIVVLRASGDGDNGEDFYRQIGGAVSVQTLVFTDRRAASDPRVLDIVRHADGVYLAGGDQANYVRYWRHTPLNAVLDANIKAGKPIGGSSAGLAVLGGFGYGAMDGGSIDAPTALGDPLGPQVTMVGDFLHLPLMGSVITDTHFTKRHRLGRLIAFLARVQAEQKRPFTGLGVDEGAAVCVDETGVARVSPGSDGSAWLVQRVRPARSLKLGQPLEAGAISITMLGPDSSLNLKTMTVTNPARRVMGHVRRGVLTTQAP